VCVDGDDGWEDCAADGRVVAEWDGGQVIEEGGFWLFGMAALVRVRRGEVLFEVIG